jgi:peptidoglycan/LPS O-acetylase OafA/YrhL
MAVVITAVFHESNWQLQSPPLDIFTQIIQWTVFDRPDINSYQNTGMIISNVTWTLNYEVFFYTTLPILYLAFFKSSNWKTILLCIFSLYFLYSIFSWSHSLKKNIIMSFAGGVIAAYWIRNPWLLDLARSRLAGALGLTSLVLVLSAFNRSFAVVPLFLITVFFITIASGNKLFFLLKTRPACWLGEISYSIYLFHGLILWLATRSLTNIVSLDTYHQTNYIYLILTITLAVVITASLTHYLIEKPGIKIGKKIASKLN